MFLMSASQLRHIRAVNWAHQLAYKVTMAEFMVKAMLKTIVMIMDTAKEEINALVIVRIMADLLTKVVVRIFPKECI